MWRSWCVSTRRRGASSGATTSVRPSSSRMTRRSLCHNLGSRPAQASWLYEVVELGYNYRLTDVQCALGLSQLPKLAARISRRQLIAEQYVRAFASMPLRSST